ncbi:MAG: Dabb family protein [Bryobacteraceae bacterium]|nr:Dabb family protein [Bryobacteraceae bacterium]
MKKLLLVLSALFIMSAGSMFAAAGTPKTVIHVITVAWKASATPAQIAAAKQAAVKMDYPGLKNVWIRPIKKQLDAPLTDIIVMEFESEAALQKYADSPAQKKFYESYMSVREESRTHDITN